MNECRNGRCSCIMGCAKNKRKKQERGARLGLVLDRVGLELGRVERWYIRVERPIFFHFLFSFSLFSLLRAKCSLLSPSSPMGRAVVGSGGSGGGWPAGAAAPPRRNPKLVFFKFFLFYSLLLPLLYTFLGSITYCPSCVSLSDHTTCGRISIIIIRI